MVEDQSDHYPKRRNHPIREQHVAAIPNTCVLNELIIRKKALLLVVQLCDNNDDCLFVHKSLHAYFQGFLST